jgi:hypothetical protein
MLNAWLLILSIKFCRHSDIHNLELSSRKRSPERDSGDPLGTS